MTSFGPLVDYPLHYIIDSGPQDRNTTRIV